MSASVTPRPQAPLIHLNGSSKQRLLDDLSEAYHAGHKMLQALATARPNQRDY